MRLLVINEQELGQEWEIPLNQVQRDQINDATRDYGNQSRDFFVNMYMKGLCEEVGEVAGILKRIDRGDYEWYFGTALEGICSEIGDVLWYLAGMASMFGWSLEEIWKHNREKIAKREAQGTIKGEGDDR